MVFGFFCWRKKVKKKEEEEGEKKEEGEEVWGPHVGKRERERGVVHVNGRGGNIWLFAWKPSQEHGMANKLWELIPMEVLV